MVIVQNTTANNPFVNHTGKVVNSYWLADQWNGRRALRHVRIHKGTMKDYDFAIPSAQNPKLLDGDLAFLEKIHETF